MVDVFAESGRQGLRGVKRAFVTRMKGFGRPLRPYGLDPLGNGAVLGTRNILSQVPKSSQMMVSAIVRTIFAQPTQAAAKQQLSLVVCQLEERFPKAMEVLKQAEEDVLAYMAFPREHWKPICRAFPLERRNRGIRRRIEGVGIFPNRDAVIRLAGAILQEQHEEWMVGRRDFSKESMAKITGGKNFLDPTSSFKNKSCH